MSEHRSQYWRSLEQLADTDEFRDFLHREFPVAASELPEEDGPDGFSRRRWMQLMGASLALGGAVGCRWPEDQIAPFQDRPENRIPGKPQVFATAWDLGGVARPITVRSFDGRPTKTAGNKQVAYTRGGTDVFDQALPLGLYDPDRADSPAEGGELRTWEEAFGMVKAVADGAVANGGESLAVIAEPTSSRVFAALRSQFLNRFPNATWVDFAGFEGSGERLGLAQSETVSLRPVYDLEAADVVVSFDADPLGSDAAASALIGGWAARRAPEDGKMNRGYAVESQFSGTGTAVDHRLPMKSSAIPAFIGKVAAAVASGSAGETPAASAQLEERMLHAIVEDLLSNRGASALLAGASLPAEAHRAVASLNIALGNVDKTVRYVEIANRPDDLAAMSDLVGEMRAGRVSDLFVFGGNPAYSCPNGVGLPAALQSVENVVRVGLYADETAVAARWLLNATHPLEQWDALTAVDGTVLSQQPLIEPILNGKSANSILAALVGSESSDRDLHHAALESAGASDIGKAVEAGFVEGSEATSASSSFGEPSLSAETGDSKYEVVIGISDTVHDGRFANNAWLQETPGRVTKVVWDNVATIAPSTAGEIGVKQNELLKITANGESVELPAFIMPGQAKGSIGVLLGYGRSDGGHVASGDPDAVKWTFDQSWLPDGPIGVDVTPLRAADSGFVLTDVAVEATGVSYPVATTQDHHAIDETGLAGIEGRVNALVREGNVEQWEEHNDFAQHVTHHPPLESLWNEWDYEKRQWGMTIDLTKCVGCSACVTACVAENNIPVVGKGQVIRGREMHWVRLDRYFAFPEDGEGSGEPDLDNPRVVTQPVACHHCENAPCEQVCPVAATVHSAEGLNDMVYNRCIGTRYCANNCPYKVRRFNFFNYNKAYQYDSQETGYDLQSLVLNPDVTVRARGVMEKCTYCVQRIKEVTQDARNDRRAIQDGDIQTACQEACPAEAIVFGDLSQDDWSVTKLSNNPRAYGMLAELNVKPRTKYLARIRNPHLSLLDLEPTSYEAAHHGDGGHGDGHEAGHDDDHGHGHDEAGHGDSDHGDEKKPATDEQASLATPRQPLVQLGSFMKNTLR